MADETVDCARAEVRRFGRRSLRDHHPRRAGTASRVEGFPELSLAALYAVESDVARNPFALDVAPTLTALREAGIATAIVSDIHVDLRPAFAAAGLDSLVSTYTLSFEQGVQKPDPVIFTRTLDALGVMAGDALMVGDRSRPDGGAVEVGITTLLLPPLYLVQECRLHNVLRLCGISTS